MNENEREGGRERTSERGRKNKRTEGDLEGLRSEEN